MDFLVKRAASMEEEVEKLLGLHQNLIQENIKLRERLKDLVQKLESSEKNLKVFRLEQDFLFSRLQNEVISLRALCQNQERTIEEMQRQLAHQTTAPPSDEARSGNQVQKYGKVLENSS